MIVVQRSLCTSATVHSNTHIAHRAAAAGDVGVWGLRCGANTLARVRRYIGLGVAVAVLMGAIAALYVRSHRATSPVRVPVRVPADVASPLHEQLLGNVDPSNEC